MRHGLSHLPYPPKFTLLWHHHRTHKAVRHTVYASNIGLLAADAADRHGLVMYFLIMALIAGGIAWIHGD